MQTVTYAPHGTVDTITYANGVSTTYDYAEVDHAMTYDDLHRLTQAAATSTDSNLSGTRNYTYGILGNILTSPLGTYLYQSTNANIFSNPHAVTKIGTTVIAYDKNGNMTSDGTFTNTWDFKNRLVTSAKTGNTITYRYDHTGNRVKKTDTTSGTPTYYIDSTYELEGTKTRHHISAPGIGTIATVTTTSTTTDYAYHHTDHLGGTHVETDSSGNLLQYMVYEPFGKIRYNYKSGSYGNDYTFTGKELDSETNLQYFGARYYAPAAGRFTSEDSIFLALGNVLVIAQITGDKNAMMALLGDPQLLNSYSYSRNNPLVNKDNNGNYVETIIDAISLALSIQEAYRHPTVWNGAMIGMDTAGLISPIPAIAGYVRYGGRIERIAKYFDRVASMSGASRSAVTSLFVKNIGFNFSRRAWSAGEAGNDVASLVGHYAKHGGEVGAVSVADYYGKANDLINSVDNQNVFRIDDLYSPGSVDYFDVRTNNLVGLNGSGQISTFQNVSDSSKLEKIYSAIE